MNTLTLKQAMTLHVVIHQQKESKFSTKDVRGKRRTHVGSIPDPSDMVGYEIFEIGIESSVAPWLRLPKSKIVSIRWSNVIAEQHGENDEPTT
jgi:hypothetical protein